ncbi:nicotinate (nicotinamide) nucleotide adenylyltransferase [Hyphomonas neptunium ATCC 15444]|uniref:Probable nicotinate-nucleotide adenylyltransferase n=2 Tax=Hyphomonas TaxID=85 RepID=Q0BWP0_HYPNA|nr:MULTISPECIES: nicotinate-nucleotide adenylyltransferase [Hyphomonas]ABI76321.1 nicotinate (nicotinamide) nucleotide adenylyltransferase [Hyphomonas neptunium ATCC 15444]KCZ91899.1 nicotinic acid mononucleotide adenylyltransferase [Hyphomonas hirschiana VP5]
MKRPRLPGPAKGLAIGLFGGSFNPAHAGHLLVAQTALKRLKLDEVWWIVARGNPLKSDHGDYAVRLASARAMAQGAGMDVTDIEDQLGLTYSIDTVRALIKAAPDARFVWLMGADNLAGFDRWKNWEEIARTLPIAVISRPGAPITKPSFFSRRFARHRLPEPQAAALAYTQAPAWVYIRTRENPTSSTALRATP